MRKVIAVDFDGCLFNSHWPDVGEPNWPVINRAFAEKQAGAALILWTCREGKELEAAVKACEECGLRFDAVNQNVPERLESWKLDCRKVGADEYWDDLAVKVTPETCKTADQMFLELGYKRLSTKTYPSYGNGKEKISIITAGKGAILRTDMLLNQKPMSKAEIKACAQAIREFEAEENG